MSSAFFYHFSISRPTTKMPTKLTLAPAVGTYSYVATSMRPFISQRFLDVSTVCARSFTTLVMGRQANKSRGSEGVQSSIFEPLSLSQCYDTSGLTRLLKGTCPRIGRVQCTFLQVREEAAFLSLPARFEWFDVHLMEYERSARCVCNGCAKKKGMQRVSQWRESNLCIQPAIRVQQALLHKPILVRYFGFVRLGMNTFYSRVHMGKRHSSCLAY